MFDAEAEQGCLPTLFSQDSNEITVHGTGIAVQAQGSTRCQEVLYKMMGEYEDELTRIDALVKSITDYGPNIFQHFLRGNSKCTSGIRFIDPGEITKREGAVAHLNATYWDQAMKALPEIYECLPQPRKDSWHTQILEMTTPDFIEDNVMATFDVLFSKREQFFAERIDGVFKALSDRHVTNAPQGFGKRMILEYVFNDWGAVETSRSGTINDLRSIISKFMGRDEPGRNQTSNDLRIIREETGVWHPLDGGSLRVRVYKKGTAHIEIHPDMAWRLNTVLHQMYPKAIPENFRRKPKKERKKVQEEAIQKPLPFEVVAVINAASIKENGTKVFLHETYGAGESAIKQAGDIMVAIGGIETARRQYVFGFDVRETIKRLVLFGLIPDKDSHQFYPTPDSVAEVVMNMAGDCSGLKCLEPSAGQGHLAKRLPAQGTTCVEISEVHCTILESNGLNVINSDFIDWSQSTSERFDRIVMNPPFRRGRWKAHLDAAYSLLAEGGRLVAVLPASATGNDLVEGCSHHWSEVIDNAFAGTSVRVVVVALEREKVANSTD